jgi:hypothetical protein
VRSSIQGHEGRARLISHKSAGCSVLDPAAAAAAAAAPPPPPKKKEKEKADPADLPIDDTMPRRRLFSSAVSTANHVWRSIVL